MQPDENAQVARFMWPTMGPPGSCRPQGPHEPCYQGSEAAVIGLKLVAPMLFDAETHTLPDSRSHTLRPPIWSVLVSVDLVLIYVLLNAELWSWLV